MHSKNIAHRDIKLDNIIVKIPSDLLINSNSKELSVKIIDFGFSVTTERSQR